ncbi:uncharacterized protein N0V89_000877 [Didymosphaeria variabile]|uniref:Auxiliary Activity family 9 catalytic domain-containing protein n=1 Tax=Didymosphaeria variabile TaxID=1932322 RepID=A0A9W8XVZ6_9PLEO|nr:uncharacterized protein N0V89_000877 [Didymosphaeria variabile]KAJ4360316.1 hypothetical protein N0V89_000877 [Didymosphaeria variabile]
MYTIALLIASAAFFETASAHGFVTQVTDQGVATKGSDPVWYYYDQNGQPRPVTAGWDALNQDNGFVSPESFTTADINCHKSAQAGQAYATVKAGDTVDFVWNPSSLKWSKISQAGLITPGGSGTWATDNLIKNSFTASTVIPKNLKAGNYVSRHEIIALHGAGSDNGAQIYPQCLNLKVTGSGTVAPTSGVVGTSLYKRTDPGILFNLYNSPSSYTIPGPALWTAAN